MANHFDVAKADRETIRQNGYCQMYAERGFNIIGAYPTAFAAYQAVPQKRGGTPPNDGNYYLIYFDGWWEGQHYGDVAVYRNGQVWSGSSVNFRKQDQSVTFAYYKSWIGTAYLCWSEYLGSRKIATIGGINMGKITKELEQVLSIMATGSKPGSAYNYPYVGMEANQANVERLVQHWQKIANDTGGLKTQNTNLKKQLATQGTILKAGKYVVQ